MARSRSQSREYQKAFRKTSAGRRHVRAMNLKQYGLTPERYDEILRQQGGVCASCKQPEKGRNQYGAVSLAVDHDHTTGQVRGLLCMRCNRSLGMLGDSAKLVWDLAVYRYTKGGAGRTAYISGRMRGLPECNFPAFFEAERLLNEKQWATINPARVDILEGTNSAETPAELRKVAWRDLVSVLGLRPGVDAVVVLPGWEESLGAKAEVGVARWVGLKVLTLEEALND